MGKIKAKADNSTEHASKINASIHKIKAYISKSEWKPDNATGYAGKTK
jgi:hypothetical protein